ncbi:hypothetical protein K883_05153 [Mycobacterium sp. TKK-01-0059]|nr:hypothetical protein K883_05153 [Mycobacterium sp. TKK-01-0059]
MRRQRLTLRRGGMHHQGDRLDFMRYFDEVINDSCNGRSKTSGATVPDVGESGWQRALPGRPPQYHFPDELRRQPTGNTVTE